MSKIEDLSNVPASVIAQQKAADEKIAAAAQEAANPNPEPGNTDQAVEVVAPIVAVQTPDAAPIEVAPVTPAISDGTTDEGQWKHKYDVLQGMHNKQVGEFKDQLVDMKAQMDRQNTVIENLNSKQLEPAPATNNAAKLNPEDFDGYGESMTTMVGQVNQLNNVVAEQAKTIATLRADGPVAQTADPQLLDRVQSIESEISDNRVVAYLKLLDTTIKGDWKAINKDPNFNKWLDSVDPIAMQARRGILSQAADQFRGAQVASIFNTYLASLAAGGDITIADELPNGSGAGEINPAAAKSKTTQADVVAAQSAFVKGKITEEEFDKVYAKFQATLRR